MMEDVKLSMPLYIENKMDVPLMVKRVINPGNEDMEFIPHDISEIVSIQPGDYVDFGTITLLTKLVKST